VVAEAMLNLACAGARPLALVNCLNFGNPEHPEVMWQLSETIDGMGDACRALSIPVVGGNVSLYNESRGRDIDPTPVIGMLGIIDRLGDTRPPTAGFVDGDRLVVVGPPAGTALDYDIHSKVCELVASLVNDRMVNGVHDVSEGGLGLALAEMAVRCGVGIRVADIDLFTESPSRVILSIDPDKVRDVHRRHMDAGVDAVRLGEAGGDRLIVDGQVDIALADAVAAWRDRIPDALGAGTAQ
jgi:phosphoribosylformylglycinamidine synthase